MASANTNTKLKRSASPSPVKSNSAWKISKIDQKSSNKGGQVVYVYGNRKLKFDPDQIMNLDGSSSEDDDSDGDDSSCSNSNGNFKFVILSF